MNKRIVSLFSGAGGLDIGFEQAGFETVFACDVCDAAVQTFNHNRDGQQCDQLDLLAMPADALVERVLERAGDRPIAGILGGPPCQGFSRGNVSQVENDPRNKLPFRYAKFLSALNARVTVDFFVFENVMGLAGPKYEATLTALRSDLAKAGFRIFESELDALDFGVPQRRRRIFIVGLNREKFPAAEFEFPEGGKAKQRRVGDVIKGLSAPVFNGDSTTIQTVHRNHITSRPVSNRFKTPSKLKTSGRSFRRLVWSKPSPTVAYGNREIAVHPTGTRRLSVYEAMRLQGFPKRYELLGNFSRQVQQVSNAVPPPVARAIARRIKSCIGGA